MPKPLSSNIATSPGQGAGRPGPPGPPGAGFSAGLDLTGTSREQTVIGFRAHPLSEDSPQDGDSYIYNSSLGRWVPGPVSGGGSGGAIRVDWAISPITSMITFAPGAGPYDVIAEFGAFSGVNVGDTILVLPAQALEGFFHNASAAPKFGGSWTVSDKQDNQSMTLARDPRMSSQSKISNIAIICADGGSAAGAYQVQTPPAAVVDVDPQVISWVALPPPEDGSTYTMQAVSGLLRWSVV